MPGIILIVHDPMDLRTADMVCIIRPRKEYTSLDSTEFINVTLIDHSLLFPEKSTFNFRQITLAKNKVLSRTRREINMLWGKSSIPP